jgi:hypothetical protein
MTIAEKYDKLIIGLVAGLILPFIVGFTIFAFSSSHFTLHSYLDRIIETHIITHSVTLCVFPNIGIFLLFNRFDMLKATRGVLAITIFWAVVVFCVKFFV